MLAWQITSDYFIDFTKKVKLVKKITINRFFIKTAISNNRNMILEEVIKIIPVIFFK